MPPRNHCKNLFNTKIYCVTACAKWHPSFLEEPLDEQEQDSSEEEERDQIESFDSQKQPENELQSSQEMDMK